MEGNSASERRVLVLGAGIIGTTTAYNLFLNVGHGHLGWTMAAAPGM